jgi:hypothetical protein
MKKLLYIVGCLFLACLFASCSTAVVTTETTKAYVHTPQLTFASEDEMVNQIKSGISNVPEYKLNELSFYYRPRELPENSKLVQIFVTNSYVTLQYSTDQLSLNDSTNSFLFIWYRSSLEEYTRMVQGSWIPIDGHDNYSFKTTVNRATGKEKLQMICWTQDGYGFQANAPLWFTSDDALIYCVAEKVQVK